MGFGRRRGGLPGGGLTKVMVWVMVIGFLLSGGWALAGPVFRGLLGFGAEAGRAVQEETGGGTGRQGLPGFGDRDSGAPVDPQVVGPGPSAPPGRLPAAALPPLLVTVEGVAAGGAEAVLGALASTAGRTVAAPAPGDQPDLVVRGGGEPALVPAAGGRPARLSVGKGGPDTQRLALLRLASPLLAAPGSVPTRTGPSACTGWTVEVERGLAATPEQILGAIGEQGGRGVAASLGGEPHVRVTQTYGSTGLQTDDGGRLEVRLPVGLETASAVQREVLLQLGPVLFGACTPVAALPDQAVDAQTSGESSSGPATQPVPPAATTGAAQEQPQGRGGSNPLGALLLVAAALGVVGYVAAPAIRARRNTPSASEGDEKPTGSGTTEPAPDDLGDDPDDLAEDEDAPDGAGVR